MSIDTVTGEIVETPSYNSVRESIAIARSHGEKFFEQIVWQVENEVWTVLGYRSWDELREAEYQDMGVVAPRADRPELVSRLRSKGLTQGQIAGTLGVSQPTVQRDLDSAPDYSNEYSEPVTNSRGQQRPASYQPRQPEPVIDPEEPREPTRAELNAQAVRDGKEFIRWANENVPQSVIDEEREASRGSLEFEGYRLVIDFVIDALKKNGDPAETVRNAPAYLRTTENEANARLAAETLTSFAKALEGATNG